VAGEGPSDVEAQVLFVGMAVSNLDASRPWYERLFGRAADIIPNENELMWRAAADAGWLYLVVDEERAGQSLAALAIADLDAELATLRSRGIRAEVVEHVGDAGGRKATLRDPDRNVVALIDVPS
jgi:catechol 2,3-dioxygenase-like lactoylglutathione lyase family enzyme